MATKVKTTVTFTFSFLSDDEDRAICSLRSWFDESSADNFQLVKDSDTGEYTYLNTNTSVGCTFKFKTPAEFIEKYSKAEGSYIPARAMMDYSGSASVSAEVETVEVEEAK